MRLTRAQAAAQAAQQIHTDNSAQSSDSDSQEKAERAPLSEIVANGAEPETSSAVPPEDKKKTTKAKGKAKKTRSRAPSPSHSDKEESVAVTLGEEEHEGAGPLAVEHSDSLETEPTLTPPEDGEVDGEDLDVEPTVSVSQVHAAEHQHDAEEEEVLEQQHIPENTQSQEEEEEEEEEEQIPGEQYIAKGQRVQEEEQTPEKQTPHDTQAQFEVHEEPPSLLDIEQEEDAHSAVGEAQSDLLTTKSTLEAESPSVEVPEINIIPQRTPAKNLLAKELASLRSTSNKENEQPLVRTAVEEQTTQTLDQAESLSALPNNAGDRVDPTGTVAEADQVDQFGPCDRVDMPLEELPDESAVGAGPEQSIETSQSKKTTTAPAEPSTKSSAKAKPLGRHPSTKSSAKPSARPSTRPSTAPTTKPSTAPSTKPSTGPSTKPSTRPSTKPSTRPSTVGPAAASRGQRVGSDQDTFLKRAPSTKKPLARPSTVNNRAPTEHKDSSRPSTSDRKDVAPVQIPHSKPRPVSISFPTPPPPPKSSRPPTKSTFQLPGEAVAAKLKAAKEERMKREAEEALHPKKKAADPPKPAPRRESVPVVIPHSRPRPVSISFPTPPPPPKSTRPPTKSTFQLPGEAIAAKLRAAREERMKQEQEDVDSRRAFKARPAPKAKESGPATVRQTASSRARESFMLGKPAPETSSASSGGVKRATSVRESMMKGRPSIATNRLSTVPRQPATVTEEGSAPTISISKRASTLPANSTIKPRTSSATTTTMTSAQRPTSSGTKKGKEVFGRAVAEKEALDKQKRDKEDAVKKAKADAAERGRIASREWAEKMKLKSLKAKQVQNPSTSATAATATAAGEAA